MVFSAAVLNRPIVANAVKKYYDKVLDLIEQELAIEKVNENSHTFNTYSRSSYLNYFSYAYRKSLIVCRKKR